MGYVSLELFKEKPDVSIGPDFMVN
jgi:hypothetical protein